MSISAEIDRSGSKTTLTYEGKADAPRTADNTVKTESDLVALIDRLASAGRSRSDVWAEASHAARKARLDLTALIRLIGERMPVEALPGSPPRPRTATPTPTPPAAAPKAVAATTAPNSDKSGFTSPEDHVLALVRTFHGHGKTRKEVVDHLLGVVDGVFGGPKPEPAVSPEKPMESSMESSMERSLQPLSLSFHHDHQDHQDHYGPLESGVPHGGNPAGPDEDRVVEQPQEEDFGTVQGRPLQEYLVWVIEEQRRSWDAGAGGEWQSALWRFTHLLTAHPDLQGLEPCAALCKVRTAMRRIQKALPAEDPRSQGDVWASLLGVSAEEAEHEFQHVWGKVELPPGGEVLPLALARSKRCELAIPAEFRKRQSADYRRFISLAGWLQIVVGAEPIALPVKRIAELLGLKAGAHRNVSNFRQWAVEDGLLVEVSKGSKSAKMAGTFVFDVDSFPILRERAKPGTAELWGRYSKGA